MAATRVLLLGAVALYAVLPLPWIVWRPQGLFYDFDLAWLPQIALAATVFLAGWVLGERARLGRPWFTSDVAEADRQWPLGTLAVIAGLVVSGAANLTLAAMGALTIDETTGRVRVPVITALASAHIFSLIYGACLLTAAPARRAPRHLFVLAFMSIAMTIAVGLIEGRRTAVALPLLVYLTLAVLGRRTVMLRRTLLAFPLLVAALAVTTYMRTGSGTSDIDEAVIVVAGDAVVGRLGNALLILDPVLEHIARERSPLDPRTLQSVLSGLPNFGLMNAPFATGYGNHFGYVLGMLPAENQHTGINSGWIGELLLAGGLPAVFLGALALAALAAIAWTLLPLAHPAGLFLRVMVVIYILSGFQMEVAFPIVSLLRAGLIAVCMALGERVVSRALRAA